MRDRRRARPLLIVLGLALVGGGCARDHPRYRYRPRPLEGRRYDTMRALARNLDQRAGRAAAEALDAAHRGSRREGRLLDSVTHFAARARGFQARLGRYPESPWDVAAEVSHLEQDARYLSGRLRSAHVFARTHDDWEAVLDVLHRMGRLLDGEE